MSDKIESFLNQFNTEDVQSLIAVIRSMISFTSSIGPEKTRERILPVLDCTKKHEDYLDSILSILVCEEDVLLNLCEVLGKMVDNVGGDEYAYRLLPILKDLNESCEDQVRKAAVKSLILISKRMSREHIMKHFVPFISSLVASEWHTSRASACSLFKEIYSLVTMEVQSLLREEYIKLLLDEVPIVRRLASKKFKKLIPVIGSKGFKQMRSVFEKVCKDKYDSVRLLSVENCIAIGALLDKEEKGEIILPILRNSIGDKSWRIRYAAANHFPDICDCVGPELTRNEFVNYFVQLLNDSEDEVRNIAVTKMSGICSKLDVPNFIKIVIPFIQNLISDPSKNVRDSFASEVTKLAPIFGKEIADTHLVPVYLQLLKDDFSQVRLNVLSRFDLVAPYLDIESLSYSVLPAVLDLAENSQWRVRLEIIKYIPLLAKELGMNFFNEKLDRLCFNWLADSVYSIREAAINNLKSLTQVFGNEWAKIKIIPKVLALRQNPTYLYRMTFLLAISVLAEVLSMEIIETMLNSVIELAYDHVPNVRFNVARTLQTLIPILDLSIIRTKVKPTLEKLINDDDADVRYFGEQAWVLIN